MRGHLTTTFIAQLAFYCSAIAGWQRARKGQSAWIFNYAFAFCLANLGFVLGLFKLMRREKIIAY
jgi:hypothetical protein